METGKTVAHRRQFSCMSGSASGCSYFATANEEIAEILYRDKSAFCMWHDRRARHEHASLGSFVSSQSEQSMKNVDVVGEELARFRRRQFGRSSEELSEAEEQRRRLCGEAEASLEGHDRESAREAIFVSSHPKRPPRLQ